MKNDSTIVLGMIGAWAEEYENTFQEAAKLSGPDGIWLSQAEALTFAEGMRRLQDGIRLVIQEEGGDISAFEPFLPSDSVTDDPTPIEQLAIFLDFDRRRGEHDANASAEGRKVK